VRDAQVRRLILFRSSRFVRFNSSTPTMITRDTPTTRRTVIYVLIMALLAGTVIFVFRRARVAAHRAPYTTAATAAQPRPK
jgi:hypothetical protein